MSWDELHRFWFGSGDLSPASIEDRVKLWFYKDRQTDETIRTRFAPWLEDFHLDHYSSWMQTPRGFVTLIVLLDQVPRNSYRGDPRSFAWDPIALKLCLERPRDMEASLTTFEKLFLFLPLQHSEVLENQAESVRHYETIVETEKNPALAEFAKENLRYARAHQEIVAKFGRFPHRNAILGRTSTPEEVEFLKQPGSSF